MIQTSLAEQMTHNFNTISERTSLIGLAHYNLHLGLGKQLGSVGFGVGGGHTVIQLRAHVVHVIRRDGHAELAAQHVPLAPHRALLLLRGEGGGLETGLCRVTGNCLQVCLALLAPSPVESKQWGIWRAVTRAAQR